KDLINHFPTYNERNLILNISYYISEEDTLLEKFKSTKQVPFESLSKAVKVSKGFLENWQDYIIVYTLILANANYISLQEYIRISSKEDVKSKVIDYKRKDGLSYRGLALKVDKKSIIILTSSGEFFKIKKSEDVNIGEETHGLEKKGIAHYKFKIFLAIALIILASIGAYKSYNKVSSTVLFNCTSQIKLEVNRGNKVVYSYAASDKGKEMINSVDPQDKNIDECLKDFMEYAKSNDMVPKDGFTVMITGDPFKYGELKETDDYIVENNIKVQINNAGSLHNVYESVQNNKSDKK
ncbi:MAG: anti-sigma factor domain-containing protein, partial [Clostridium sp.]|nr:anti-sigma factor domain-containing protein [Clostridium sp.]